MYLSQDVLISCMVSVEGYSDKESAIRSLSRQTLKPKQHQIGFKYESVTIDNLINKIINGHSIVPGNLNVVGFGTGIDIVSNKSNGSLSSVFWKRGKYKFSVKNTFRKNKNVNSVQLIAIDVDNSGAFNSIEDIVSVLEYKPTFGYYTYSDTPDKRRFRLIYVFDKEFPYIDQNVEVNDIDNIKNVNRYNDVCEALYWLFQNNTRLIPDNCGRKPEQIMAGTNKKNYYVSYQVYEESDFNNIIKNSRSNIQINALFNPNSIIIFNDNLTREINKRILFGGYKNSHSSLNELFSYYRENYNVNYYYRKESDNWIEHSKLNGVFWQFTTDNYFSLIPPSSKITENRRNWLLLRLRTRRLFRNDPDELLYNLAVDVKLFVDNKDKKYDVDYLKAMVQNICSKPDSVIQEIIDNTSEYTLCKKSKIIVKYIPKKNKEKLETEFGMSFKGIVQSCIKESKLYIFKQHYNSLLSDKENLNIINTETDLKLSIRTYQRYKQECRLEIGYISKEDRDKLITDLINEGLKHKEIIQKLKTEFNISVTRQTITNIKKRI